MIPILHRRPPIDTGWNLDFESLAVELAERGFAVRPSAFPDDELRGLADEAQSAWERGDYHRAGVGRGDQLSVRSEIRTDHVLWLDTDHLSRLQRRYCATLENLRLAIKRTLYLDVHELEAHFAMYAPGAFYARHLDQFRDNPQRLVSCLLYLNWDWYETDGGQLRLYLPTPERECSLDILPSAGTFVVFLSDRIEHEVLSTLRPRLSLTGWLLRRRLL